LRALWYVRHGLPARPGKPVTASNSLPGLAIVVVNYGSHALLEKNLLAVAGHTPDAKIVVVDSFSSVFERQQVREQAKEYGWELLTPEENVGFGKGVNLGVAHAASLGFRTFLLINPDATVDHTSLATLRDTAAANPMTLISPTIVRPDGSPWFAGSDLYMDTGRTASVRRRDPRRMLRTEPWLSGACLIVTQPLWELVGGFDEEFFLYWEDIDLSHRVMQAGGQLAVLPQAHAVHDEGGTHADPARPGGDRGKSPTYYYFNIRNRLLFGARHLEEADLKRWRATAIPAAYEILLRGGRRQFLRPVGPVTAAIRGTRDGLRISGDKRRRRASAWGEGVTHGSYQK